MSRGLRFAVFLLLVLCTRSASAKRGASKANESAVPKNRCNPTFHLIPLRHYDYVAAFEDDVLSHVLTGNCFLVIKRVFHLPAVFHPQNVDLLFSRELRKSSGTGQRLQYSHI